METRCPKIGPRLLKRLAELKMTQAEFARRAGLSTGRVSHYISGKHRPETRAVQERIAAALGVTLKWFER